MSLVEAPGRGNRLGGWLAQHGRTLGAALGRMARAPVATSMSVLVVSVTLALPAALHLAVANTLRLSGGWEQATDFSVFLEPAVDEATARQLATIVDKRADVAAVEFVHKDAALDEFRGHAGFADVIDGLSENPLPHALVVRPAELADAATIAVLKTDLANLPETDLVQLDTEWIERFRAVLALIERGVLTIAALLGAGVLVIIGNTVRLDIQSRRDEIVITKLVGASNGFIRRPFLYSGLLLGTVGGLAALIVVAVSLWLLGAPVQRLAGLYASGFTLEGLSLGESLVLIAIGSALGWLGALVATGRHLRQIEPK